MEYYLRISVMLNFKQILYKNAKLDFEHLMTNKWQQLFFSMTVKMILV